MSTSGNAERIEQEADDLAGRDPFEREEGDGSASRRPPDRVDPSGKEGAPSWLSWQSAFYALITDVICVLLVPLTGLWWLVLVFGVLISLALATNGRWGTPSIASNRKGQESELLKALARGGEVTPVTVAMRTSLTVDEASKGLEGLARNGHLKFRTDDGAFVYSLRPQDRQDPSGIRGLAPSSLKRSLKAPSGGVLRSP
jgi:hypothetical protein